MSNKIGPIGECTDFAPEEVVKEAKRDGCASIACTYTEPTIFFEYAYETVSLARQAGLRNVFVTNGYMTRKALDTAAPFLDADTLCPACVEPVVKRTAGGLRRKKIVEVRCYLCGAEIDGAKAVTRAHHSTAGVQN
jgi:hypothetical protein